MYFLGVLSLGNPKPSPKVKKKGNTTNKLIFHLMVTLSPREIIIFPFFKDSSHPHFLKQNFNENLL